MKRTSTVVGRCSKDDSKNKRDALCKLLYTRLFDWIISYINSIISKEKKTYSRIGLLDIYGFEILDVNSLEQLCINFANEKLQQLYVHQYLQVRKKDHFVAHRCCEFQPWELDWEKRIWLFNYNWMKMCLKSNSLAIDFDQQLQEDLKREEVQWISISYNDNRPCLDALEKGPESIIGTWANSISMNEVCRR